ncbi:uncharacterized protein LOC110183970 [Drosophila serrata]|uniref:uncharacterized protein LOC110179936 n=1 Tax=Drosophila serrata TaxID=7274 RepID=UPI000A1D1698|nr:uncharacterized protein LOC110179936 [Drosophila serrata]XP_020807984.1 uncharacterized protein LOC110183970 [Drosophila serrata]
MKCLALVVLLALLVTLLAGSSEASYCPCDLKTKATQICGSNGVTYQNRCEFECTQRDYRKLGRSLNVRKEGQC